MSAKRDLGASPCIISETQGTVAGPMCKCTMGGFSRGYIAFLNLDVRYEVVQTL
jgi:hypothetical protein